MHAILLLLALAAEPATDWKVFKQTADSTEWRDATGRYAIIKGESGLYHNVLIVDGLRRDLSEGVHFDTFDEAADDAKAHVRGQARTINAVKGILDGSAFNNGRSNLRPQKHGIPSRWQSVQGSDKTATQTLMSTSGDYKVVRKKQAYTLSARDGNGFKPLDNPPEEYATMQAAVDRAVLDWRKKQEDADGLKQSADEPSQRPQKAMNDEAISEEKPAPQDAKRTLVLEHKEGKSERIPTGRVNAGQVNALQRKHYEQLKNGGHTFQVDDHWELEWDAPGGLERIYLKPSGGSPISLGTRREPLKSRGTRYFKKGGTFSVTVSNSDPWTIRVYQLNEGPVAEKEQGSEHTADSSGTSQPRASVEQAEDAPKIKVHDGKKVPVRDNAQARASTKSKPKVMTCEAFVDDLLNPFIESWADLRKEGTTEQLKVAKASLLKSTNDSFKKRSVAVWFTVRDVAAESDTVSYRIICSNVEGVDNLLKYNKRAQHYSFLWHPKNRAEMLAVMPGDFVEIVGTPTIEVQQRAGGPGPKSTLFATLPAGALYIDNYSLSIIPKNKRIDGAANDE